MVIYLFSVRNNSMTVSALDTSVPTLTDREDVAAAAGRREPDQTRYLIVSVVVATLIFLVGVGGGIWLAGADIPGSLGVGAFAAFWGGPGFGLMAGFALYNLSVERRAARH